MKKYYFLWVIGALLLLSSQAFAQSAKYWDIAPNNFDIPKSQLLLGQLPTDYKFAVLDVAGMYQDLSAPKAASANATPLLISLPTPEGNFIDFYLTETSVVSPEVAHLFTVKTFKGYAKSARQTTIRCDISPTGFHAVVFNGGAAYSIEPASRSNPSAHIVYYKSDFKADPFKCGVTGEHHKHGQKPASDDPVKTPTNLRTYRLAIIADATFRTQFGGMPYNATNVLNAFAAGLNMINEVYERDLGVTFTLVSNTACANAVLADHTDIDEVHTFLVSSSGLTGSGFDVGHSLLWDNTGGVAYLGVVCNSGLKGGGFSGTTGSLTQLYVDYMAHELGHQFGANHTFASAECGTSEPSFRYETGEGSTIMAYAGVCGAPPSYQNFSDPFFHAASIGEINAYLSSSGGCAAVSTPGTGNNAAPVVNAQANITIPKQTPFVLVGSATDGNNDPVSFAWQQYDGAGLATTGSPNCASTTQPLFRFRPPVTDNFRVFPQMSDVLAGNNNTPAWEKLPCAARTLNFRLTVRDNNANWGRTAFDDMVVTVANTGPFNVTAPNGGESWQANSNQSVTWTVNGTDAHCTNVDILVSTDNGVTYSLVGTYPNNGSASITVPNTPSTSARVIVQCSVGGNFRSASTFFDVSNAVFSITEPAACNGLRISQVYGGGGNTFTHDYVELYNGGSTAVSLNGLSIQYASATGTGNLGSSSTQLTELPNVTIQPGRYFLVQQANGTTTTALPTPDYIDPTPIALSATTGKVALVNATTSLGCNGGSAPCNSTQLALIIDLVGYGTANFFEGSGPAPTPSNTTAILRNGNGCTDNNNNSSDFITGTPAPRNSASPVNTCGLVLTITDNVCPSTAGTISGSGCLGGTILEYATNEAGPWSTTAPTYTTSPITVYARCRNTTTGCSGPPVSGTTAPNVCSSCPVLTSAPGEVQIANSTCTANCTVTGGSITAPTVGCPTGSTLQYNVNGVGWTTNLPSYNTTGPAQTIQTRCSCDTDPNTVSPASTGVATIPGTCTTPAAPTGTLAIVNSACSNCTVSGGSIAIGTVAGSGGTLQYSTDGGTTWSATLPTYNQTGPAQTILASVLGANGCRSNTTQVGQTNPGTCTTPAAPTGTLAIVNSICNGCTPGGGSIAIGTVAGSGGTLQYSTDGGATWSATLPAYNQSGPAQTIIASVLGANGCRSNTTQVGQTTPATCAGPSAPTGALAIVNSTCSNCTVSGGSIAIGTVSGTGGTLEYSTDGGATWSAMLPAYNQSGPAQTILASVLDGNGCRSNTTQVGQTNPGACTTPAAPTGALAIVNSTCSNCIVSGGSIAIGTVAGSGGTLQYSTDGGTTWSATLPAYNQTGPAQTILASVLGANGCRSNTTQVGQTNPGTCTTPAAPTGTLAIVNSICNGCTASGGSIAIGTVSGTGGTLQYSTDGGATWSAMLPAYNQSGPAQTIIASVLGANGCRSNTTQVGQTMPATCAVPSAPTGTLAIVNSTCSNCTLSGGSIAIGTVSGTGGTLEYSTDGGATWSATLPTYNQSGPAQTILASVLDGNGCRSNTTQVGQTNPGTCTTPAAPTGALAIVNSTCSNCTVSGGSIAVGTVAGVGGTLQYSTDGGATWSATLPTYNQTGPAQTIIASVLGANGCRSNTTQVGQTTPGTCTTPAAPTGTLAIVNSACNNCVVGGGSIAMGTVAGVGGTLQYSTDGGATWNAALPTYNQTGPAQTIIASVLGANGCRSNTTLVGTTAPGNCDNQPFTTYYVDGDGDGFGAGVGQLFCNNPGPGFSLLNTDCDDNNDDVNPAATEVCDGIDNDCDGNIDNVNGNSGGTWQQGVVGNSGVGNTNFPPCDPSPTDVFTVGSTNVSSPTADNVNFVYQTLCGNSSITARVLTVDGGGWAGVMMRETLSPGAKKVALKTQLTSIVRRDIRTTNNGPTSSLNFNRPQHVWLRIERNGSTLTGYTSVNGASWTFAFSASISMAPCIYVGIFSESINVNTTTNATFDNVATTGGGVLPLAGVQPGSQAADQQPVINFGLFPNPTTGEVALDLEQWFGKAIRIEVISITGQTVFIREIDEVQSAIESLSLSKYHPGMYLIKVRSADTEATQRLIIQR